MLTTLDVWTWAMFGALLVVMGIRAWVVETGTSRYNIRSAPERMLTAVAVILVLTLVVLVAINGGLQLFEMLISGADGVQ